MKLPKYREHKRHGTAFVEIRSRRIYLGKFNSPDSLQKYHRILAELAVNESAIALSQGRSKPLVTVNGLIAEFLSHAKKRYVKNGQQTSEVRSFKSALSPVHRLYGRAPVDEFGPLALRACRQALIDKGVCRKRINQHVGRIRRAFKWGVSLEIVKESTWTALLSVEGLRKGEAPDKPKIRAATEDQIAKVMPYLTPPVRAMMEFQLWTACRPGEACIIRGCDLSTSGDVWEYRPHSHKREHHDLERVIWIGPHAQAILKPWLRTDLEAYLFSPRDGRRAYLQSLERKTPKSPSQKKRKPAKNPKRAPSKSYSENSYSRAIDKAAKKAGLKKLRPNQFRKAAATRIRAAYGIELARIILGHQSTVTSEIYAEADRQKAVEAMRQLG